MTKEVVVKTINKVYDDKIKAGITWFKFIAAINNIQLAKRELELLAFINYRGTISSTSAKEEFVKIFNSSIGTVTNMTSRLLKLRLLVKENAKTKISPSLRVDFENKDFVVRFFINVNKPETTEDES
jgi:hypothetical protein